MSTDEGKVLVRRFFEQVFNQRDEAATAELLPASFVAHHPAFPEGIRGPEGIKGVVAFFRGAFPDLRYTPEDLVAEGDKVAVRWVARGTHQGPFQGIPPTGKQVTVTGIDIFRVADGRLEEAWVNSDLLGLLQQLGAIPSPGQAAG